MINLLFQKLNLKWQMLFVASCGVASLAVVVATVALSAEGSNGNWRLAAGVATVLALALLVIAQLLGTFCARRAEQIVHGLGALAKGDTTHRVAIPGKDEFAWMSYEYSNVRKSFAAMITEIGGNAEQLASAAEELSAITGQARQGMETQSLETGHVASAMGEMASTVHDVAANASNAAVETDQANKEAIAGRAVACATVQGIEDLARDVEQTAEAIARLKEDSVAIGKVMDVIKNIADQTNLLALNAAIEAARAGEHGRGFAVVADEVRTLAGRTQQSTQEIQDVVQRLQAGATAAVAAMDKGRQSARIGVEQASHAGQSLDRIATVVERIAHLNAQIARAAESQSTRTDEVNHNVSTISAIAEETLEGARQTAGASEDLAQLAAQLKTLIGRFKVAG